VLELLRADIQRLPELIRAAEPPPQADAPAAAGVPEPPPVPDADQLGLFG
jgi:hypothetical protein